MITSPQLADSIAGLKLLRKTIPPAVQASVDPRKMEHKLRQIAAETLSSIKASGYVNPETFPELEEYAAHILATFSIKATGDRGFVVSLGPFTEKDIARRQFANTVDGIPYLSREAVTAWVEKYKKLTSEDQTSHGYISHRKIALRVIFALLNNPAPWYDTSVPGEGALRPEGLVAQLGLTPRKSDQLSFMLTSVLAAWKGYVARSVVVRLNSNLNKMLQ